jgi:hypothetical protein
MKQSGVGREDGEEALERSRTRLLKAVEFRVSAPGISTLKADWAGGLIGDLSLVDNFRQGAFAAVAVEFTAEDLFPGATPAYANSTAWQVSDELDFWKSRRVELTTPPMLLVRH